ncbi:MAG: hypothetical protein Q7K33_04085 [Candidatus Berkelbacteria bacterium]|nr:hypothetical protein [Candidatus Berkelbacteria bacterium]
MKKLFLMLAIMGALASILSAQKIGVSATGTAAKQPKVAFLPLMFQENDKGEREYTQSAREPYEKALYGAFERLGMERLGPVVNFAWRELKGAVFDTAAFELPDPANLVKLGQKLGADYVVVSRCRYNVRSDWQGLGPKTRADATVDLWIVDVASSEFALKQERIFSHSREKAPDWRIAVDLFLAPISAFSGGPKTDHEAKAGLLSLGKAIQPWLDKMQARGVKIRIGG